MPLDLPAAEVNQLMAPGRPNTWTIVIAALALGLLGDLLLRGLPWGINVSLWTLALVLVVLVLAKRPGVRQRVGALWPLPIAIVFAMGFAWRDAPAVKAADMLALLALLAATALRASPLQTRLLTMTDMFFAATTAGVHALLGSGMLLKNDIPWGPGERSRWLRHAPPAARGIVLAAPGLLVFGGLFAASDAAFASIMGRLTGFDVANLIGHLALIALLTWLVGGFIRGLLLAGTVASPNGISRQSLDLRLGVNDSAIDAFAKSTFWLLRQAISLGRIETAIVLGTFDLLFLSFVVVQLRYFFGGAALVEASVSLTYSEYARRGFFELVTVAALVLPELLLLQWLLDANDGRLQRLFRWLAAAQILLLFVIMASALQRMRLYQQAYGLTELRFYATAFMGWLAAVFIWFMATVLTGRRERFALGGVVAGLITILAVNVLNPAALIARINTERSATGQRFDAAYAVSLGADAVPELLRGLPSLDQRDRCLVAGEILQRWSSGNPDWRTWTWSSVRARRTVRDSSGELEQIRCQ